MRENFAAALVAVLKHEGGWSDHPSDPGGATMKGVTLATFRRYKPGASKADLRAISDAYLQKIYRDGYWNEIKGDELPSGVDYAVFDFAVNSGPARAAIYLQNIVGAAPDGKIGPLTIGKAEEYVRRFGADQLVNELCSQRLAFLQRLSTWPTFGKGWGARVAGVRKLGMEMAHAVPPRAPIDLPDEHEPAAPKKRRTLADLLREIFVRQATAHVAHQLKDTPLMNSNFLHNILNIAIALVAILSLPEVTAVLPPELGVVVAGTLAALKTIINIARDGFGGLFKEQPPVR